jgi:hypothetical protein
VDALVLRDEEIDCVDVERIQERDINLIIRLRHGTEFGFQLGFRWLAYTCELFELSDLAQRDGAAPGVAVATYVLSGAFMDEDSYAVLRTELLQGRKIWRNFTLIFKTYEDVRINE